MLIEGNAPQGPKTLPRKHIFRFLIALTPLNLLLHCIKNIEFKQSKYLIRSIAPEPRGKRSVSLAMSVVSTSPFEFDAESDEEKSEK